jgi:formate dehydrogenase subunit delta
MMSNLERLVYMANQIARNLRAQAPDNAVAATADHIAKFWDPRMRQQIRAHLAAGGEGLDEIARDAAGQLIESGVPPSQTPATEFNTGNLVGHSDGG